MSSAGTPSRNETAPPQFAQTMGHPSPLWMLFMSEFWERFAFYGIRWALVLYIVAQFHAGSATGQAEANLTYGSYLAMVYAVAIFGGYVADGDPREVRAASGLTGRQLKYTREERGRKQRFWMAVFVTADRVWVVEAGGDAERFTEKAQKSVQRAIETLQLG